MRDEEFKRLYQMCREYLLRVGEQGGTIDWWYFHSLFDEVRLSAVLSPRNSQRSVLQEGQQSSPLPRQKDR